MTDPLDRVTDAELALHEALRRSHCDHRNNRDPKHKCMGVTTITPRGVKLSCVLCGNGDLEDRIGESQAGHYAQIEVTRSTKRHLAVLNRTVSCALIELMSTTNEMAMRYKPDEEEP